jgi:hypothetical protein
MKLSITEEGDNIVIGKKTEMLCFGCKSYNMEDVFFCEIEKKIYCYTCMARSRACHSHREHIDFKINKVQYERD